MLAKQLLQAIDRLRVEAGGQHLHGGLRPATEVSAAVFGDPEQVGDQRRHQRLREVRAQRGAIRFQGHSPQTASVGLSEDYELLDKPDAAARLTQMIWTTHTEVLMMWSLSDELPNNLFCYVFAISWRHQIALVGLTVITFLLEIVPLEIVALPFRMVSSLSSSS